MNRDVAARMESTDWETSAWHYRAAGDAAAAARVLDNAIDEVFASGQFEIARPFLDGSAGSRERPGALILRSRIELARGSYSKASELGRAAVAAATDTPLAGQALLNMSSLLGFGGIQDDAAHFAQAALTAGLPLSQRRIAEASVWMWRAARDGNLEAIADDLRHLALQQDRDGHHRYAGISRINLAHVLLWIGDAADAMEQATQAQVDLGGRRSASAEYTAALAAQATSVAQLGRLDEARSILEGALDWSSALGRDEALLELAKIMSDFGDASDANAALSLVASPESPGLGNVATLITGSVAIRRGDVAQALASVQMLDQHPCTDVAGWLRGQILRTRAHLLAEAEDIGAQLDSLTRLAVAQTLSTWPPVAALLRAIAGGTDLGMEVARLRDDDLYVLSLVAEEIARNLHRASHERKATDRLGGKTTSATVEGRPQNDRRNRRSE